MAINDLGPVETNAHLLRYDSVHGRFPREVKVDGDTIDVGRGTDQGDRRSRTRPSCRTRSWASTSRSNAPASSPRKDKASAHLDGRRQAGARLGPGRRRRPTPSSTASTTTSSTKDHVVVSNGSCTTNCLAPVAKVLNDAVGIEHGFMTTIHSYTGDQPTLDTMHKDLYRGRAAALSMIPTSTGAAKAVGLVLPELKGKLDGVSIRVPTPNVSVVDLKFVAKRDDRRKDEINEAIKRGRRTASSRASWRAPTQPLVSIDFNHDPHSSTFHLDQTKVIDGTFVRVLAWYDNEWGFSNRMADTAVAMGKLG